MDFSLNREQELIRKMIAAFTENEVKPIAAEIDRTHEFPAENIRKMFQLGIMGMTVPKEYGGAGADQVSAAIVTGGAGQGMRLHQRHRGRSHAVLRAHSGARHRGAEAQVSAHADRGRRAGRYGHHRTQRRLRCLQVPRRRLVWRATTMSSTAPRSSSPTAPRPACS